MDIDKARLLFQAESAELLQEMEQLLLGATPGAMATDAMNALFRVAHTIKGSAGLFGLAGTTRFAHAMETVLDALRDGTLRLDAGLIDLLLKCHDEMARLLAGTENGQDPEADPAMLAALAACLDPAGAASRDGAPDPGATTRWLLSLHFAPDAFRQGIDPLSFIRHLASLGTLARVVPLPDTLPADETFDPGCCRIGFEVLLDSPADADTLASAFLFAGDDAVILIRPLAAVSIGTDAQRLPEQRREAARAVWQQMQPVTTAPAAHRAPPAAGRFVRVDARRLDALIEQIGEVLIASAAHGLLASRSGQAALAESARALDALLGEVRTTAMSMRMVPVADLFGRFERVIRDAAAETGKRVQLVTTGGETEVDKSMLEPLGDAMLHLVRNAIGHGIELPAARLAAGKPETGQLRLNAYHDAGNIVLELADDGAGLDEAKILARAQARGLVDPEASLSAADVRALIFRPGFSTADAVTSLSGRGVGMDVVQTTIDGLRGEIGIESTPGVGTLFRVRLPLTLAIIDGFLVEAGGGAFVIPLPLIEECIALPDAHADAEAGTVRFADRMLPVVALDRHLGLPRSAARRRSVVVLRCGDQSMGVVVDALRGEFQAVIRPLGPLFARLGVFSGSTILDSGRVALILDGLALLRQVARREADEYGPA